jgi:hypothetical protein
MHIKATYVPTRRELFRSELAKGRVANWVLAGSLVLWALIALWAYAIGAYFKAGLMGVLLPSLIVFRLASLYRAIGNRPQGEHRVEITEQGFVIATAATRSVLEWSDLVALRETGSFWLLEAWGELEFTLPKRALSGPDRAQFAEFFARRRLALAR